MLVAQWFLTLCDPMDCTPPGSSIHAIFQARMMGWVAISFSRGSCQPRDWTQVSCTAGRFFTNWTTRKAQKHFFEPVFFFWGGGKNTEVGCHSLLQIFPTQGSNPGLPLCRQTLCHLSHQGSPYFQTFLLNMCFQTLGLPWCLIW